jgi:uncharacterized protein (DUF433 family)
MSLRLTTPSLPLRLDIDGVVRVGATRVTLDTVVDAFNEGFEPEEIVRHYPVPSLADVYATIAYYLQHRAEVDDYVAQRRTSAETLRRVCSEQTDTRAIRERLLDRRGTAG